MHIMQLVSLSLSLYALLCVIFFIAFILTESITVYYCLSVGVHEIHVAFLQQVL